MSHEVRWITKALTLPKKLDIFDGKNPSTYGLLDLSQRLQVWKWKLVFALIARSVITSKLALIAQKSFHFLMW